MFKYIRASALAVAVGGLVVLGSGGAFAQTANPCAAKPMEDKKAANPCAPKTENPCAPKAGNPCAPKK